MELHEIISKALEEDIGHGDVTTEALDDCDKIQNAKLVAKADGIIAGLPVAKAVFMQTNPDVEFTSLVRDGDEVSAGDVIATIASTALSLLSAERVALNFLQRLSGIATQTRELVLLIGDNPARLLDTRKTTPLLRQLEKYAVRMGGGLNHRFGLFDMVMLKENHIRTAGSITSAVEQVKLHVTHCKIEVEVTNLQELAEALSAGVDRIMLDNMPIALMEQAVQKFGKKVELEASGNITSNNIAAVAATGVHYISAGAVTHSYRSMDISLIFNPVNQRDRRSSNEE